MAERREGIEGHDNFLSQLRDVLVEGATYSPAPETHVKKIIDPKMVQEATALYRERNQVK